jgi:hypothetical protein
MKHIELHILDTEQDALLAENTGLTTFATFEYCSNCEEQIAFTANGFYPCALVLSEIADEEIEFLICQTCISPILEN